MLGKEFLLNFILSLEGNMDIPIFSDTVVGKEIRSNNPITFDSPGVIYSFTPTGSDDSYITITYPEGTTQKFYLHSHLTGSGESSSWSHSSTFKVPCFIPAGTVVSASTWASGTLHFYPVKTWISSKSFTQGGG